MGTSSVQRKVVNAAILLVSITILDILSASLTLSLPQPSDGPQVTLSATSLFFKTQPAGTTSAAQAIILRNAGNAVLNITRPTITGTKASDFTQTNNCGSSLAVGANCTISVTFSPTVRGSETASLSITDNASGSPQIVRLSGTGTAPVAGASPTTLAFGNEPITVTSSPQSVTLNNTGNAALSNISISFTGANAGDFGDNTTCGSSLAAGSNCTIAVTFSPSMAGTETASLSISDNASGSPQTVSLSGTGIHAVILSWDPSPTAGVVGYYVYRGTSSGGESTTPLNSSPVAGGCTSPTTCTYIDETVQAGQEYWYEVAAVASDGITQSAPSTQVSVIVPFKLVPL